jgi:hypothetical protein
MATDAGGHMIGLAANVMHWHVPMQGRDFDAVCGQGVVRSIRVAAFPRFVVC